MRRTRRCETAARGRRAWLGGEEPENGQGPEGSWGWSDILATDFPKPLPHSAPAPSRVTTLLSHHPPASPALPAGLAPVQTLSGTILPIPGGCHGCQADRHTTAALSVKLVLWSKPGWTCW